MLVADEERTLGDLVAPVSGSLEFMVSPPSGSRRQRAFGYHVELDFAEGDRVPSHTRHVGIGRLGERRRVDHLAPGTWRIRLVNSMKRDLSQREQLLQIRPGETARLEWTLSK